MSSITKRCDICGKTFIAHNKRSHVCFRAECRRAYHRIVASENRDRNKHMNFKELDNPEPHVRKPDTIIAIGYAERQMAQTLEMAGKVKV